uniref:Uncharacterized protein n=1 Tax=Siphoviridae sp. ct6d71 TaxID=2826298 RepID=A0A8S5R338_9CAUD|nr:MAG TPA: hypothetical protein [Siphoviridae sp. ct6d71]
MKFFKWKCEEPKPERAWLRYSLTYYVSRLSIVTVINC